jgi:hypothetical protein
MNVQRLSGLVLMVVGVVLLIVGINSSDSLVDQVNESFTGRFTDSTMWYILGGIALGVVGLLMMIFNFGGKLRAGSYR